MEVKNRQPMGVELFKRGIVTEKDIEEATNYQQTHPNLNIGEILYILNVCDREKLAIAVGEIIVEEEFYLDHKMLN